MSQSHQIKSCHQSEAQDALSLMKIKRRLGNSKVARYKIKIYHLKRKQREPTKKAKRKKAKSEFKATRVP